MNIDVILIGAVVSAVLNIAVVVYYSMLLRRAHKLNILLGQLCVKAFVEQHLPYWKPWADTFGYNLQIRVVPELKDTSCQ